MKQLEASGASLIAVHARYRGTPTHRRDGPAHLDQVAIIKKAVSVPVLANGNIKSWTDVEANLQVTGADGVMSAEGMLDDPCLFAGGWKATTKDKELRKVEKKIRQLQKLRQKKADGAVLSSQEEEKVALRKELKGKRKELLEQISKESEAKSEEKLPKVPKDGLVKAREYLAFVKKYPPSPPLSTLIFHCRRMAKSELTAFQLLEDFKAASSLKEVHQLLSKAESYRDAPGSFQASKEKEQKDRQLRAQHTYEMDCRRKYEQRMARKAARLGVSLQEVMKGSAVPGGALQFNNEPSWLTEKGDVEDPIATGKSCEARESLDRLVCH